MIVFVPTSPEVPRYHVPRYWQSLVFVLILSITYLFSEPLVEKDAKYVQGIFKLVEKGPANQLMDEYLSVRPLLEIAPSRADWSIEKLFAANFIHGSNVHLMLNLPSEARCHDLQPGT